MAARLPWMGLFALLGGTFAAVLSMSFLFPATPYIVADFGVSLEGAAWLSLSYALGATIFEPMFGRLGDIYGRKRNVILGLSTFTIGAIIAAISPQFWVMVGARFVQGLGAAAVIPVGMAFIGEHFPPEMRGRTLGLWSMVNGVGPALGPTLGGILIDAFNWRAIYWASFLLGLLGVALVAAFVPESRRGQRESFDYLGSAALFVAAGSLLVVLTQGRSWGWISLNTLLWMVLTFAGSMVFLRVEAKATHPLVDLSFVKTRSFLLPALTVFLSFFAFQANFFMLPFFLEQVQGYNARQSGNMAIPLFVALAGSSFFAGRISDRFHAKHIVLAGTILTAVAIYLFTWLRVNTPYWYILIIMALLGFGIGVTLPPLSRSIIGMVEPRKMGAVSGIFNMFRNFGGPFGTALSATLFSQRVATRAQESFVTAAAQAGIPLGLLQSLGQGKQPSLNYADPTLAAKLKALGPRVTELQQYASIHGMASAMVDVAWVMLGVCGLMLIVALLLPNLRPLSRDPRALQRRSAIQGGPGVPLAPNRLANEVPPETR